MEFLVIGVVTAVNMIVILLKFKHGRLEDAIFDVALLTTVTVLFAGSYGGMVVAMIASMIISIYLYANPPKFFKGALASDEAKSLINSFNKLRTELTTPTKKKPKPINIKDFKL